MSDSILMMFAMLLAITFIANIVFCIIELHNLLKAKVQKARLEVDELLHCKNRELGKIFLTFWVRYANWFSG